MIINGFDYEYLKAGQWQDPVHSNGLNGRKVFRRFKRFVANADVMPIDEFNQLHTLEGQIVDIVAVDYDDRNAEKAYFQVNFTNLSHSHIGLNVESVNAEFLVLV